MKMRWGSLPAVCIDCAKVKSSCVGVKGTRPATRRRMRRHGHTPRSRTCAWPQGLPRNGPLIKTSSKPDIVHNHGEFVTVRRCASDSASHSPRQARVKPAVVTTPVVCPPHRSAGKVAQIIFANGLLLGAYFLAEDKSVQTKRVFPDLAIDPAFARTPGHPSPSRHRRRHSP